jgi:hypothetical protein
LRLRADSDAERGDRSASELNSARKCGGGKFHGVVSKMKSVNRKNNRSVKTVLHLQKMFR